MSLLSCIPYRLNLTPTLVSPQAQSLASSLSTRQLLRICRRLSEHPEESVARSVNKACLSRSTSKYSILPFCCWWNIPNVLNVNLDFAIVRFLPSLASASLAKSLSDCSIQDSSEPAAPHDLSCESAAARDRIDKNKTLPGNTREFNNSS